jgi:hypothetical protein
MSDADWSDLIRILVNGPRPGEDARVRELISVISRADVDAQAYHLVRESWAVAVVEAPRAVVAA